MSSLDTQVWTTWDSAAFETLAQAHGTPFFLYDADAINRRITTIRQAFCGMVEVFYAVKANPNLGVLKAVRASADGLDISSSGELEQACIAGFDPGRLSFAGPAKTSKELTQAIECSIGYISVESSLELHECIRIARHTGCKANVVLRVNPLLLNRAFGLKMGGKAVQFGIDEENLPGLLQAVAESQQDIAFQGIHVYAGSQCFEAAGIVEGVANTFRLVRRIEEETRLRCKTINLGGGFGVSHTELDRQLDVATLADTLNPILREFLDSSAITRKVVFELGRYLTAHAGIYVSRVISDKVSRGKQFCMVDGGLHHHLAAAGTFGAALRSNYILRNLTRPAAERIRCHVAGPSCNPTDLLGIDVEIPRPEVGDLIGVLMAGSYGLTASPLLFLGRTTPAEWVCHDGRVTIARLPRPMTDFN